MSLIRYLPEVQGVYRENANLSKSNWFNVGGPAQVLYKPKDISDLSLFLKNKPNDIPYIILGCGSNVIIRDSGFPGVVIKLSKDFCNYSVEDNFITVGAGFLSYNLARLALEHSIGNLEFFTGIPGTVGGNLAMNAGCYGSDTESVLVSATVIDTDGNILNLKKEDIGFSYRSNNLPNGWIFVEAKFLGEKKDKEIIQSRLEAINNLRQSTQPIREKTSGSSFKNPEGYKAWELIDKAGCRGLRIGGAIVSEKHCNFLINDNNATASDIENLGEEVRRRVKEKFNIELEWEIKIIGLEDINIEELRYA